ncbi:uracil-DNA glycosylase [Bacillus sp. FSL K6-3431]|uniref:uracil-DNA glycosylase n=1 Tax=Bacillus sp. FSL K6-3431 TaxID=2921500 RepID=UPI0030FC5B39
MGILNTDWELLLKAEFDKPYYINLLSFLKDEYKEKVIYPEQKDIFNALEYTPYKNVKAVILGQDPYHGHGQAHGLSFSVKPDVKIPPSLRNIFKEMENDLGYTPPNNGYLTKWAEQGVLMLNTVLTVRAGEAHSHRGKGWETLTDKVISLINEREQPVVFILWGRPAQEKIKLINTGKHKIIQSPHPSPFAARKGFFDSKPFSKTNEFLQELGMEQIDWQISNL